MERMEEHEVEWWRTAIEDVGELLVWTHSAVVYSQNPYADDVVVQGTRVISPGAVFRVAVRDVWLYCVSHVQYYLQFLFFFFQAEDGIRDATVTGVQTCALPISASWSLGAPASRGSDIPGAGGP